MTQAPQGRFKSSMTSLLLAPKLVMYTKFLSFLSVLITASAFAGIDSGAGKSAIGSYQNHGSIGSITTTGAKTADYLVNRNGLVEVLYAVPTTDALDSDNDNIPDAWESDNGLTIGVDDSAADLDGDGSSNFMEYIAGTNPQSASSAQQPGLQNNSGVWSMSVDTVKGRHYRLYISMDLENWQTWDNFTGNGNTVNFTFDPDSTAAQDLFHPANPIDKVFFRVELTIAP